MSNRKKKPRGMKQRVREYKKRVRYIGTIITVAILVIIIAISGFFIYSSLHSSPNPADDQTNNQTPPPKAAIVDHLSFREETANPTFVQNATTTLQNANFTVDYYPGKDVNVTFYRKLPTLGHNLIILRVHSAIIYGLGDNESLGLFTSERYDEHKAETTYRQYVLHNQLVEAYFTGEEREQGTSYFGIAPGFIEHSMEGQFRNTTIIMMGCDGLTYNKTAQAFINKGAKVYIGWSGLVSTDHTDKATIHLLQHLITENQTVYDAVFQTFLEVKPDPSFGSILLFHPFDGEPYWIEREEH